MKIKFPALFSVLLALNSCETAGDHSSTTSAAPVSASADRSKPAAARSAGVPDRPEKLSFPALNYEPPNPREYRVELKSGPVAYIVPDHELPLVNLTIFVRTGQYVVPSGKEGLSDLAGHLLARGGTKSKTAEELEERLAFLAAHLNSSVGETQGSISLNLLSKDLAEGLDILREVLTAPRFQEDKIALLKDQTLQNMKQRNDDSRNIEEREHDFLAHGENFWANRHTTAASLEGLTRDDLQQFHRKWFHPANFVVAANGDFDHAEMAARLEKLFSDWPFKGEKPPAIPSDTHLAKPGVYIVDKEVNQGRVAIMLPGIMREDPDYFPVVIMNDILGGGGFTSHIMNRVRSDEGLAYSAGSSFPGGVYYPSVFNAAFQSKSRTVPYAVSIVLDEIKTFPEQLVTDEELNTSKRGFIDRFPRAFGTKAQIAGTFAGDEFSGRFPKNFDYYKNYRARMDAVKKEDLQRVAKKYLTPQQQVILIVGQKEEILKGHPAHPVSLESLAGGKIIDVPLRDPLTMKPMSR